MKKTNSAIISAIMIVLMTCPGTKGQENGKIWFTQVPDWGNPAMDLIGRVDVNPQEYMVAGIIFVEEAGGWCSGEGGERGRAAAGG